MPDIDTSPAALRARAEAATPGPWQVVTYRTPFSITRHDGTTCSGEHVGRDIATVRHHPQIHAPYPIVTLGIGVTQETPVHFVFIRPEDADYLAAVSPEVVLALLDTIDALRASLAAAEKERDEADAGFEAIEAKFATLCRVGRDCGCSYDAKDHVCMYHSPQLVAAVKRAEKAEAERDAARWQPIETAPLDGTRLWCFWPDAEPEERQAIGWFVSYGEDEYWTDAADSDPNPPTHWMPLPAAPANPEDPAHD